MTWESHVLDILTASIARPFGLVAAAWLLLRFLRVRHPASQHAVWTAVLIGMLLVPGVSMIAPHWALPPIPHPHHSTNRAIATNSPAPDIEPLDSFTRPGGLARDSNGRTALASEWPPISTLVAWCYLAGVLAMALYRLIGCVLLRSVTSSARLVRGRRVLESRDLAAPAAAGVLRPRVILPAGWREWDIATKRAVLAHEFAHLRRQDTRISALTRLAECVLWFHPLTWWLSRKIHELAELACDAEAVEKIGDPARYSRILLGFADAVSRSGHRAALPGLAMASTSNIGRRIDGVFELSGGAMRRLPQPVLLLALVGSPVICLAATVGFSESNAAWRIPRLKPAPARSTTARRSMSARRPIFPRFSSSRAWPRERLPNKARLRPSRPRRCRLGFSARLQGLSSKWPQSSLARATMQAAEEDRAAAGERPRPAH